jgi:hypothetical protein
LPGSSVNHLAFRLRAYALNIDPAPRHMNRKSGASRCQFFNDEGLTLDIS